jgi:predicted enzyme related to lactoylglutathione lyase
VEHAARGRPGPGTLFATTLAIGIAVAASITLSPRVSASTTPGEFVWHDLVTHDAAASKAFYGALFGWTFQPGQGVDPGYVMIKQGGDPIGGIVTVAKDTALPQWVSYVTVANVDEAAKAFTDAGGKVYRAPLDARKDLRVAVVGDAQGAPLGLASRGRPDAPAGVPAVNRWLWMEYVAVDAPRALEFYGRALGYTNEARPTAGGLNYHVLKAGPARAGLFQSPWKREASAWLPYVRVGDPAAMAAKVTQLGGTVVLAPSPELRNGSVAVVLDPAGAALALQKYPFEKGQP